MFAHTDVNASVTKVDADHQTVTPSPAKHPRTSLRGDSTPVTGDVSNGPVDSKSKGKAPAKGSVGKTKGKQKARPSGDVEDGKEGTQVERRAARVVAEDSLKYTADTMRCPLPGCDSKGNVLLNKKRFYYANALQKLLPSCYVFIANYKLLLTFLLATVLSCLCRLFLIKRI